MTLQLDYPRTFFSTAGSYSGNWDERAQVWWANRVMDAVVWSPVYLNVAKSGRDIDRLEGAAVVQYGHRAEIDVIVPRFNAYVAELQRQFAAGFPIGTDTATVNSDDIAAVRDWLASLDERMLGKLWKLSWAQGVEHAKKWHAALAKAVEDRSAGETDISRRIESQDGWTWCRLGSARAMDREGAVMGHCVGEGSYDGYATMDEQVWGIWSLRDAEGRSRVTVEVTGNGWRGDKPVRRLAQAKGPKNRPLNDGENQHLGVLLAALEVDTSSRPHPYQALMDQYVQVAMAEVLGRDPVRRVPEPIYFMDEIDWNNEQPAIDFAAMPRYAQPIRSSGTITMSVRQLTTEFRDIVRAGMEDAEDVRRRLADDFREVMARRMRVAFGLEAPDEAPPIVNSQLGIAFEFDSQGGSLPDGSAIVDTVAFAMSTARMPPPPPPHYRQHERRGRMYGRT